MNLQLRDQDYRMEVSADTFFDYEEKVMTSGLCDFALPMQFYYHGNRTEVRYQCSGYTAISQWETITPELSFEVAEKLLTAYRHAGEFLIDPERIILEPEMVFFHGRHRDVKIAYLPGQAMAASRRIAGFLHDLRDRSCEEAKEPLSRAVETIRRENRDIRDSLVLIQTMRRELRQAGEGKEPMEKGA